MADDKLIFPIGFDLEEGVKNASKEWKSTYQKQLQKAIDDKPLKAKIELPAKGFNIKEIKEYIGLSKEIAKANRDIAKTRSENALVAQRESRQRVQESTELDQIRQKKAQAALAEERLRQAKERSTKTTHKQNSAYKTQSTYLARLAQRMIAYASVSQVLQFLRNIREVTAQFELQRVALGSIIGDLNTANTMFEQIKAAAVKSPFQIKQLVSYTKQLAAYKIETDELFETTQKLADVSAGLGVGMERLVLAYGQIRATGYLRASEVRQLTEAGIPIVEELAKKMSQLRGETVSAAEVMGMISERAISFGMVKEVFDDMTSAGGMFYKMQEKQAETLAGQISNLKDSFAIMYDEIGRSENVNSTMKSMIGLVKSLAENWRTVSAITLMASGTVLTYAKVIKPLLALDAKRLLINKAFDAYSKARLAYQNYQRTGLNLFLEEYKAQVKLAKGYRESAKAMKGFGITMKSIMTFLKNNWIGIALTIATTIASALWAARQEAQRLNKELAKIGAEGALQSDQSVRNFERLARAIRESANGSVEQSEAMAEMRRAYGEFLPSQDQEILNLVREKQGYDAVIEAIRKKIALQTQEQQINTVTSEFGQQLGGVKDDIRKSLEKSGLSRTEISLLFAEIEKGVKDGTINLSTVVEKIPEIFKNITGQTLHYVKIISDAGRNFWGNSYLMKYIDILTKYENKLKDIISDTQALNKPSKNLSDTFNTWQKELASITEGKNLKGEGIRLFDDESIAQTPKLTSALEKVAEKYKKLKEEKKQVDKALLSEGAKADKQTYSQLEQRLGKINEGMSGLYDFLKKYGGLDLIKDGDKGGELARLQKELQLHEKIYAKYKEYRKYMSAEEAKAKVENYFGDTIDALKFKPSFDKSGYQNVLEQYKKVANTLLAKAKDETEKGAIKKFLLDIGFKIDDKDWEETKDDMEKNLKKLSDDLSRTKTAKEFFDRMLGLTGDKQLSATLTMSVYGEGGEDLGTKLAKQTADAFKAKYKGINFSKTAISDKGVFDWDTILAEGKKQKGKFGTSEYDKFLKDVDAGRKASAKRLDTLMNELEKTKTYSEKLVDIYTNTQERLNTIDQEVEDDAARKRLKEQVKALQTKEMQKLQYESFKDSPMYVAMFENLDATSTAMLTNMRNHIVKLRDAWKEGLDPTQLKELQSRINEIDKQLATRNPFKGIVDGIKEMNALGNRKQDEQSLLDATTKKLEAERAYQEAVKSGKPTEEIERLAKKLGDCVKAEDKAARKMSEWDDATQKVMQGMQSLGQVTQLVQTTTTAVNDIVEAFGGWGDTADEEFWNTILDGVNKFVGGTQSAIEGIGRIASGDILGGVTSLVSGIGSIVSAIGDWIYADRVRQAEKEIERQQEIIDNLAYSYERLEKAQEKAFGSDYISNYEQRLANLQAQQEAYLKQADAERSKGKKADADKIKEYEEQARAATDAIKDMQSELSEYFLGSDLTSAARDFANAWIEAYKEFGSTTDAMKEKFQDMIQNMIVESFAAKVIQSALSDIFTEIDNMTKDGVLDMSEASKITDMTEVAVGNIDVGMTNLMNALSQAGISVRGMGSDLTGISRDIATASEESILGLAAGINTQNFYISQVPPKLDVIIGLLQGGNLAQGSAITLQDLVTIQNQHLSYLPSIAQHTAETVTECKQIVAETRRTADALEKVIKPRGTQTTHTLNATIN